MACSTLDRVRQISGQLLGEPALSCAGTSYLPFRGVSRSVRVLFTFMTATAASFAELPPITLPEGDFAGFIFDCDGTLADSMPLHYRAWSYAYREHGASFEFTWETFYSLAGTGLEDSVRILNERYRDNLHPAAVVATQAQWLVAHQDTMQAIEPVVVVARELKRRFPVSVASGGIRQAVHDTLRIIGLEGHFDPVVTRDDVARGKPAPDSFLLAAEKMGVDPARCLVFEDSPLGLKAAESAGMQWVYVSPEIYSAGAGI